MTIDTNVDTNDMMNSGPNNTVDISPEIRARPAGFAADVVSIAGRALRAVPKDLAAVVPPVL
ncbi:MAG: hypothetical protein WKF60_04310, partial [Ilumatobacter sp.]